MVAAVNACRAARADLANTAPSTLVGLVAYLDFVAVQSDFYGEPLFDDDDETRDFIRSLARFARSCLQVGTWVRIPGKHRNQDAAWDALEDMIATRH
jgi:hypothetical protein